MRNALPGAGASEISDKHPGVRMNRKKKKHGRETANLLFHGVNSKLVGDLYYDQSSNKLTRPHAVNHA